MSRKNRAVVREVLPDPRYQDVVVTKFINCLMKEGKKSIAEKIFYGAMELIEKKTGEEPLKVFKKALSNIKPAVEVKSRRIGGATYQVPIEIPENRRMALAMRWIISFARSRKGNSMVDRLSAELIAASKNEGSAIKKKEDTHKMADANKAFAHFR